MAEPVRARRLSDEEGRRLQQIVRRGKHGSIRVRRAMIIMDSSSGTPVPAIARLVAADEDTVRDVIHAFNAKGLAALDPQWAGGRPRLIGDDDVKFIVTAALTRPEELGLPFTHWSVRKLAAYLASDTQRPVRTGRERLRQILHEQEISFQRTRTWKESTDPDRDAKLDRIDHVTTHFPDRCFAFDQFGPLQMTLSGQQGLAEITHPDYPGERLVACRNPVLAADRARTCDSLLEAAEKLLAPIIARVAAGRLTGAAAIGVAVGKVIGKYKVGKHFAVTITGTSLAVQRRQDQIDAEAAFDGIYVLRTSVPAGQLDASGVVSAYKNLARVERDFRHIKIDDLDLRPSGTGSKSA